MKRSVCAVIENDRGEILTVLSVKHGGAPELPGGKLLLDRGDGQPETCEEALARELWEECHGVIHAAAEVLTREIDVPSRAETHLCTVYAVTLTPESERELEGSPEGPIAWSTRKAILDRGTYRDVVQTEFDAYDAHKARKRASRPNLSLDDARALIDLLLEWAFHPSRIAWRSETVGLETVFAVHAETSPGEGYTFQHVYPTELRDDPSLGVLHMLREVYYAAGAEVPALNVRDETPRWSTMLGAIGGDTRRAFPMPFRPEVVEYMLAHGRPCAARRTLYADLPAVGRAGRRTVLASVREAALAATVYEAYDPHDRHCGNPYCSPAGTSDCPENHPAGEVMLRPDLSGADPDYVDDEGNEMRVRGPRAEADARFLASARRVILALADELESLRAYEHATRDTVCWGVACVHEAHALDMLARGQAALDAARTAASADRARIVKLTAENEALRAAPLSHWRKGIPTAEEIARHDETHPVLYFSSGQHGQWQVRWTNGVGTHYEIVTFAEASRIERLCVYDTEWRPLDALASPVPRYDADRNDGA